MQTPHQPGQSPMSLSQHSTPVSGQPQQQLHQSAMEHQVNQSQPLHSRRVSPQSNVRSCKAEGGHNVSATVCANCGTTTTPLWRRAPNGETICNACGLYLKARNTTRPPWLKRNAIKKSTPSTSAQVPDNNPSTNAGSCPGDGHCDGTGGSISCSGCPAYNQHQVNRQALICANCGTNTTPLWRRDEAGNTICNACGLYFKLHNVHRPETMRRSVIKRRKRVALATSPPPTSHHHRHHSGSNVDGDPSCKNRVQQHPLTPVSSSGSEHGYSDSEDDVFSNDGHTSTGQKRKISASHPNNKRQCGNIRQVPAIEDYNPTKQRDNEPIWNHNNNNLDERRRSLSPVEPSLSSSPSLPQVQIHQGNNSPLTGGRLMGTPTIPLPSGFSGTTGFQSSHSSNIRSSSQGNTISALLNPTSPTCASPPQLPPITIPSAMDHSISMHDHIHHQSQSPVEPLVTQQILHAHRQALQREVSHLSMLLKRTTAILVDLDQAMNANDTNSKSNPSTPPALNQLPPMCLSNDTSISTLNNSHLHNNSATTQSYMTLPPVALVGSRSPSPQS